MKENLRREKEVCFEMMKEKKVRGDNKSLEESCHLKGIPRITEVSLCNADGEAWK